MTKTDLNQDFGYQDFTLVQAPLDAVVDAVEKSTSGDANLDASSVAEPWKPKGLVGYLLKMTPLGKAMARAADMEVDMPLSDDPLPSYNVSRGQAASAPMLMTSAYTPSFGPQAQSSGFDMKDDIRLRQVLNTNWVLVEHYEHGTGMSMMGFDLSMSLPQTDVLYFRRSGTQAKELRYDFHVYRDGMNERRVLCHCTHPNGDPQQAWWEGISDCEKSSYEPDDLYTGVTEATLLDNRGIDRILKHMDLTVASLFRSTDDMILFSRDLSAPA